MAATKYQIFYRYINPNTGNPITNDSTIEYKETFKFYTDDHKIVTGTETEQFEEEQERDQLMIDGNSANNDKNDMFFVYSGTVKIYHEKYLGSGNWKTMSGIPDGYPYIIKDTYTKVPFNSPWLRGPIYGSLQAALEKCRIIATSIGIENVKLVKIVPYGQKIDIV
jgi:hypothetical protein